MESLIARIAIGLILIAYLTLTAIAIHHIRKAKTGYEDARRRGYYSAEEINEQ